MSTQIEALRGYLKSAIETMAFNISQYETAIQQHDDVSWSYPGTYEEAKGKYRGYQEIYRMVGGQ